MTPKHLASSVLSSLSYPLTAIDCSGPFSVRIKRSYLLIYPLFLFIFVFSISGRNSQMTHATSWHKIRQISGATLEYHSPSLTDFFPDTPSNMAKEVELPGVEKKAWSLKCQK